LEGQNVAILDWRLADKPVIVTGASSGIGAATARQLGSLGASVVLAGRNRDRLDAVAHDVEAEGGKAHVVIAELTDIDQAEGVVAEAVSAFGGLHGIAHLASVFDPRPLADTTLESFEVQWRSSVAAPLFMTKAAVPHLKPGSSVVLVARRSHSSVSRAVAPTRRRKAPWSPSAARSPSSSRRTASV
jgi:NAD(P)-dependent dehydrogenase (short-subunit alcohol dehydrogenase family)